MAEEDCDSALNNDVDISCAYRMLFHIVQGHNTAFTRRPSDILLRYSWWKCIFPLNNDNARLLTHTPTHTNTPIHKYMYAYWKHLLPLHWAAYWIHTQMKWIIIAHRRWLAHNIKWKSKCPSLDTRDACLVTHISCQVIIIYYLPKNRLASRSSRYRLECFWTWNHIFTHKPNKMRKFNKKSFFIFRKRIAITLCETHDSIYHRAQMMICICRKMIPTSL